MPSDVPQVVDGELVGEDETGNEIAVRSTTLFHTSDPRLALDRMAEISNAVVDVIERQRFYVVIAGKKYVTCPGWKTAGGMFGLSPYTAFTRPNESGDGYVARVEVRTLDERTIAAAEAECARDETNWKNRPKHALRSMAETRATSRALRGPLEQVFALGGYEGTAAEEMPTDVAEPAAPSPAKDDGKIPPEIRPTKEQAARMRELLDELAVKYPDEDWPAAAREFAGVPGDHLTTTIADAVIRWLEKMRETP